MRDNYTAWNIDFNEFEKLKVDEDRLKFLLKFAVLAPSGHNAQPWKVKLLKNGFEIVYEKSRRLPVGDPKDRLLYIGVGAFIENLALAADYYGYSVTSKIVENGNIVAQIILKQARKKRPTKHLAVVIPKRVTNRNQYSNKLPSESVLGSMKKLSNKNIEVTYLKNKSNLSSLCEDVVNANINTFESNAFREELSRHIRTNVTKKKTGMPAFGMGMPTIISFITPLLIKLTNVNKMSYKKDLDVFKNHTPLFFLISSRGNKRSDWVNVGRVFERISLIATREGMSVSPQAGPVIINKYAVRMKNYFNSKLIPQMFFRMGYPEKETPHSPRLSVEEILS